MVRGSYAAEPALVPLREPDKRRRTDMTSDAEASWHRRAATPPIQRGLTPTKDFTTSTLVFAPGWNF